MDEKQIQARQEMSRRVREAIDKKMGLETSDLWNNVKLSMANITRRAAQSAEPAQAFDFDLHDLWYILMQSAKVTPADSPVQAWLVTQVLYARELGALQRPAAVEGEGGSRAVVRTAEGVIWTDLPFLVADVTEAWRGSEKLPLVERQNLGAFIARLVAVGVCDPLLGPCALWSLHGALEAPVDTESEPELETKVDGVNGVVEEKGENGESRKNGENGNHTSPAEAVMVALVWLRYCGHKLLIWSMQNLQVSEEQGEGFSLARWARWKLLLDSMRDSEDITLANCALRGHNLMEQVEMDFGIPT
ncbi:uncharacterized protein K452DRAFT_291946 [Aplosporella prunicola CBS 121167]|uniref:Uncharacterized protein n=1 Tax=Aplosporella prunicola CBS 121167 TaxID=1176127 RepID=A0A6A6B0F8_9PEZI|nr:uncharacterized protein K452DRAFT_291946 [Aplosporella prunicola CBS 121167]KAF2137038.1 hypothetical protein K452DRAFT_291946 [Aplosporella prunicola CBS 121167]